MKHRDIPDLLEDGFSRVDDEIKMAVYPHHAQGAVFLTQLFDSRVFVFTDNAQALLAKIVDVEKTELELDPWRLQEAFELFSVHVMEALALAPENSTFLQYRETGVYALHACLPEAIRKGGSRSLVMALSRQSAGARIFSEIQTVEPGWDENLFKIPADGLLVNEIAPPAPEGVPDEFAHQSLDLNQGQYQEIVSLRESGELEIRGKSLRWRIPPS